MERLFSSIKINERKESFLSFYKYKKRLRFLQEFNNSCNADYLRDILQGVCDIRIKATENKDGTLNYASKEDLNAISSIVNYYENKFSVDGVFFKDLTGIESFIFEDKLIHCKSLDITNNSSENLSRFVKSLN